MATKDFAFVFLLGVAIATSLGCSKGSTEAAPGSSSKAVPNEPPPTTPAGPEELALIAPLIVGSKLGAYEVTKILAVHKGVLEIFCRNDRAQVRLSIALLSEKGPEPPAQTDKYAVFYSNRGGDPADAERLAKSLAEILGKHSDVPVPKGMTEFVPSAIPM